MKFKKGDVLIDYTKFQNGFSEGFIWNVTDVDTKLNTYSIWNYEMRYGNSFKYSYIERHMRLLDEVKLKYPERFI